jgi:hypothetical protein
MKIGTRLGIFGSTFLLAAFGISASSASAHSRALAASGVFAPQQEQQQEHPDDKKPEVNPPEKPSTHDEKKPVEKETRPPVREDHPPEAHPTPKPNHEKETEEKKTNTKETEHKQTQTRTHQNVHYTVQSKNVTVVKTHYREELTHVDRGHRPHWAVGGFIDRGQITYIQPVPAEVIVGFPAAPSGLIWGYWEGYCILYDPNTLEIVYVIDLL